MSMKWYYVVGLFLFIGFLFQKNNDDSDIRYLRDEINDLEFRLNKENKTMSKELKSLESRIDNLEYDRY